MNQTCAMIIAIITSIQIKLQKYANLAILDVINANKDQNKVVIYVIHSIIETLSIENVSVLKDFTLTKTDQQFVLHVKV